MINLSRINGMTGQLQTPSITANSIKGHRRGPYEISLSNFPRPKKFYATCKFLFGRRGTAKSLSMVFMAWSLSNAYDQYLGPAYDCKICHYKHRPVRIAANFKCDFADIQDPYLVDRLQSYPEWAHDLVVLIDEIATYVPSSRAMAKTTLGLGTWLQQIRKRRIEIIMATQFPQDITRNVLRQVDFFMEPDPIAEGRHVKLYFYDIWGQFSGDYSYKKWPPTREDSFTEKTLPRTYRVWNQYDTEEIFAPVFADHRDRMVDESGWTFDQTVDELAGGPTDRSRSLVLPGGQVEQAEDIDGYLRQLLARGNTGELNIGRIFSDVKERFKDDIDWATRPQLETYLTDQLGWEVYTVGQGANNRRAKPPQEEPSE